MNQLSTNRSGFYTSHRSLITSHLSYKSELHSLHILQ
jgi:hypothetical protein